MYTSKLYTSSKSTKKKKKTKTVTQTGMTFDKF